MLNYADIAICLIILLSLSIGIYKGLVKEVLSLASLVLALLVAFYLSDYPVQWLMPISQDWGGEWFGINIEGDSIVFIASFILLFIATLILGRLLAAALSNLIVQNAILKSVNRIFGGVFGLLRGALIVILLVIFAGLTKVSVYPWWQESQLLPPFITGAQHVVELLPSQYSWHFDFDLPDSEEDSPMELELAPEREADEPSI